MGSISEDKILDAAKSPVRTPVERRPSKVTKRSSKDKRTVKNLDIDSVAELLESSSPDIHDAQDGRDKRQQGVVIDGKTYTCATCKSGHRVGICKHARERPMTATHPPGRPAAGAPKKIVCDCPKQCACKKRDCKCARNCSCTQMMYMLVYVPAPGEEEQNDAETGTWKLGQPVTTDLRGNVLTPEQIKQRQEQKEAQKTQTVESRAGSVFDGFNVPRNEAKPKEQGGCCKHKENVTSRKIVEETSPKTGKVSTAGADGCNCGKTCSCAFCPQHPNNLTSLNMARQQAVHFANQPYNNDPQSIVSFMPTMPQGASCMGGMPTFAISRYSQQPSYQDLQRAFPNPGYVIGYPIWSTRTNSEGYPVAPFPTQPHYLPDMGMINSNGFEVAQPPAPTPTPMMELGSSFSGVSPVGFSQDEFDIGDAFVASAGPGTWDQSFMSPAMWSAESTVTTPAVTSMLDNSHFLTQPADLNGHHTPSLTDDVAYGFPANYSASGNTFYDINSTTPSVSGIGIGQHGVLHETYSSGTATTDSATDNRNHLGGHISPNGENAATLDLPPQG